MNFPQSDSVDETLPKPEPKRLPRIKSLEHRLEHAKDTAGKPLDLRDELLFFLEVPPPEVGDRWQAGADLCASHGITTSRMSVWRFFHAKIIEWRRSQAPALPARKPSAAKTARLHEQARHLAAQRMLDMLADPNLPAGHLVGYLQSDNHRQQIQLARDEFNDKVSERKRVLQREFYRNVDKRIEKEVAEKFHRKYFAENFERVLKAQDAARAEAKAKLHTTS